MSHEIRTPINAIMGIAELERQDLDAGNINEENIARYTKETLTVLWVIWYPATKR